MMVKFTTTCDHCGQRADEYTAWPSCRDCGLDTCPMCDVPDLRTEADLDTPPTTRCLQCTVEVQDVRP